MATKISKMIQGEKARKLAELLRSTGRARPSPFPAIPPRKATAKWDFYAVLYERR